MIATMLRSEWQYRPWHLGWAEGWWWVVPVVGALLLVAIIGILVWAVVRGGRNRPNTTGAARQILAERFARGEIGEEEYRARLGQLPDHGAA